jgi:histidine triad (HIT) family protein
MAAGCLFCQVVSGEVPASIVFQDEFALAFLDHRPLFPGHCLLIPKAHIETLGDLPAPAVGPLFGTAQLLAGAIERALQAEGTFVAINNKVSQSVPHLHVHVVPRLLLAEGKIQGSRTHGKRAAGAGEGHEPRRMNPHAFYV